jgi:hypothetical protein
MFVALFFMGSQLLRLSFHSVDEPEAPPRLSAARNTDFYPRMVDFPRPGFPETDISLEAVADQISQTFAPAAAMLHLGRQWR